MTKSKYSITSQVSRSYGGLSAADFLFSGNSSPGNDNVSY